ncbi:MAG: hypothetical protein ACP5LE_08100, partial [Thermoplasmata archaeon]
MRFFPLLISLLFLLSPYGNSQSEIDVPQSLVEREPIEIIGNENFTHENGVVSGSGTAEDPYIIGGFLITINASAPQCAIYVENTTAYFVITNVRIICEGSSEAIYFKVGCMFINVTHGRIEFTEIEKPTSGITVENSTDICFSYIKINENSHIGMAIGIWGCENIIIQNSTVVNSTGFRTVYVRDSTNISFKENNFDHYLHPLHIVASSNVEFVENKFFCYNSSWDPPIYAVVLNNTTQCSIWLNEFYFCGVYASNGSKQNRIFANTFWKTKNTTQNCNDFSSENSWCYQGIGNFWYPTEIADNDLDGIGDTPYPIDNDTFDYFPVLSIPLIRHTPPEEVPTNLSVEVIDVRGGGIAEVVLNYRFNLSENFSQKEMEFINGSSCWGTYTSSTISLPTNASVFQYFFTAKNIYGNVSTTKIYERELALRPAPPRNLSVSNEKGEVMIKWSQPSNTSFPLLSYHIYRGLSPGTENLYATVNASTTTFTDTNVSFGVTYYY